MKGQLRFDAIFNSDPPQVQCSGWCYSEAEADTGEWKHCLKAERFTDFDFLPYSLQLCLDYREVQPHLRLLQARQDHVQRSVCRHGQWKRNKVATILNFFLYLQSLFKVAVEDVPKRQKAPGHGLRHTFP